MACSPSVVAGCGTITEGAWYHPMLSIYDAGLECPKAIEYILVNVCTATMNTRHAWCCL